MIKRILIILLSTLQGALWAQQEVVYLQTDKGLYLSGETVWFSAWCLDTESRQASLLSKVLYVELLDAEAQSVLRQKVWLEDGKAQGQLFIDGELSTGMYYLKAYTRWMKNYEPAAFYEGAIRVVHPFRSPDNLMAPEGPSKSQLEIEPNLFFQTDRESYGNREAITLELAPLEESELASLSVSVYKSDSLNPTPVGNLHRYLRARRTQREPEAYPYNSEPISPMIHGQASRSLDSLFVLFPGRNARIYSVRLDEEGRFSFPLSPWIGQENMIFWAMGQPLGTIEMEDPFVEEHEIYFPIEWDIDSSDLPFLKSLSLNSQIDNAYLSHSLVRGEKPEPKLLTYFYGEPDWDYRLDDYTRFPVMDEVFLEIIRYAHRRNRRKGEYLDVSDYFANLHSPSSSIHFGEPALVLVDGIPIPNMDFIWELDPLKVERIHIVGRKYFVGDHVFPGVVNFITYKRNYAGQPFPEQVLEKKYQPLESTRQFHSPNHQEPDSIGHRIPDYRTLLYWDGGLEWQTDQPHQIRFFSGDDIGHYRIEVNGITRNGKTIYGTGSFTVR